MKWATAGLTVALTFGCGAEPAATPAASSRGELADRDGESPYRVAVISDLNGGYGATAYGEEVHAAVDRLVALRPDLVLSTGDMVAGQRAGVDHDAMWASFHAAVSDRLRDASIPFAVTPGNHDASGYPRWERERSAFVDQWAPRRPDVRMIDGDGYPLRYSFVAGPAFFVSLDATTVGPLDDDQMRWLDAQLAAAPRDVVVVFGHLPLHPFTHRRERETIGDPRLEALLARHEVDVFVSGHHHAYYPGRRGSLRLVSTACLGAGPRRLLGSDDVSERSILVFELSGDGMGALDAFGGERFDRRIDRASLPEQVGLEGREIRRDDLVDGPSS